MMKAIWGLVGFWIVLFCIECCLVAIMAAGLATLQEEVKELEKRVLIMESLPWLIDQETREKLAPRWAEGDF